MSLWIKFNVAMLAACLIGLLLAGALLDTILLRNARSEAQDEAATIMAAMNSAIHYTDSQVTPLLHDQMKQQFLPQSVPFLAAQEIFDLMPQRSPGYGFRQPALNPTNQADLATDWEDTIIKSFLAKPDLDQVVTERQTKEGDVVSVAQPIRVSNDGCLSCHSTPETAPASMVDVYGSKNGFGWKLGAIVGSKIVSVPERATIERARYSLFETLATVAIVFLIMLCVLNVLLHVLILAPIRRFAARAEEMSLGNMDVADFDPPSWDEIGSLAVSFNRMRRSLETAMGMLEG